MKTSEDILKELNESLEEARSVTREIHQATKDFRQIVKVERERAENILREETAKAIAQISDDVRSYLEASVDAMIERFKERLFKE